MIMSYKNCRHDAPEEYCHQCNTDEEIKSRSIGLLSCVNCIDGTDYHHDPLGDWEEDCRICNGTGMLTKEQSEARHKFLAYYWKKKTAR